MESKKLTAGLPAGEMFVGGKRLIGRNLLASQSDYEDHDNHEIPSLSRTSTESTASEENEMEEEDEMPVMLYPCSPMSSVYSDGLPSKPKRSLVDVSTSASGSAEDEAEAHYSQVETKRLFGGPLSRLYRARNFEPFTDPFVVFEQVFEAQIFKMSENELGRLKEWMPLRPTRAAGWQGSSHTSPDGKSTTFTTSRLLHDRRLTRTETVTVDPVSGKTHCFVTVTAETLEPTTIEEEADKEFVRGNACLICYKTTESSGDVGGETASGCGDFYVTYSEMLDEFDQGTKDIFQTWMDVFACNEYTFANWNCS
jgi:hypothetical protein